MFCIFLTGFVFGAWANKMVTNAGNREESGRLGILEFPNKKLPVFDMDDLLRASAQVLGRGNLGITYKATLEIGNVVVVKRLSYMNELSKKEFLQQMQLLGQIKHENLVEVISFYYSEEQKLIIYELISDGTLFELLHGQLSSFFPYLYSYIRIAISYGRKMTKLMQSHDRTHVFHS